MQLLVSPDKWKTHLYFKIYKIQKTNNKKPCIKWSFSLFLALHGIHFCFVINGIGRISTTKLYYYRKYCIISTIIILRGYHHLGKIPSSEKNDSYKNVWSPTQIAPLTWKKINKYKNKERRRKAEKMTA